MLCKNRVAWWAAIPNTAAAPSAAKAIHIDNSNRSASVQRRKRPYATGISPNTAIRTTVNLFQPMSQYSDSQGSLQVVKALVSAALRSGGRGAIAARRRWGKRLTGKWVIRENCESSTNITGRPHYQDVIIPDGLVVRLAAL